MLKSPLTASNIRGRTQCPSCIMVCIMAAFLLSRVAMPVTVNALSPISAFYQGGTLLHLTGSLFFNTTQLTVSFAPSVGDTLRVLGTFVSATEVRTGWIYRAYLTDSCDYTYFRELSRPNGGSGCGAERSTIHGLARRLARVQYVHNI